MAKKVKNTAAKNTAAPAVVEVVAAPVVVEAVGEYIEVDAANAANAEIEAAARRKMRIGVVALGFADAQKWTATNAVDGAMVFMEVYGEDMAWTTTHAANLKGEGRELYARLMEVLKTANYSKPAMVWKRIREEAVKLAPKVFDATQESAEGESAEVEGAREKVRRLCEKDIQSMYNRIKKAEDVDRDVLSLLPDLTAMAKRIGLTLKEPE